MTRLVVLARGEPCEGWLPGALEAYNSAEVVVRRGAVPGAYHVCRHPTLPEGTVISADALVEASAGNSDETAT